MGRLTPVFITECVPSDMFQGSSEILVRLAPLLAPIYDQIQMYVHFFFVPNRLLWEDWEEFITGGRLGEAVDAPPVPPYFLIEDIRILPDFVAKSSLLDYLGVPLLDDLAGVGDYGTATIDAMPVIAYQLIWQEYYRDRNFEESTYVFPVPSGDVSANTVSGLNYLVIRERMYAHDYFTSALPFTQRGAEVLMPLAGSGSVTYMDVSHAKTQAGANANSNLLIGTGSPLAGGENVYVNKTGADSSGTLGRIENIDEVILDASSVSINDFRAAYALQVWLERNAIGGSRYTESTQAHFGVRPQDSRLQRPEYVGGGRIQVRISEVVSTAYSNDGTDNVPLANLGGHGIAYGNTNQFRYFCSEHGFIIGIASIMAPASYHQGLPRMFRRRSFLDYPWPTFAKLGEQEVHKFEVYANPTNMTEDVNGNVPLFGYQSRYADWKYIANRNSGEFHDTLLFWTLTRDFTGGGPTLSAAFNRFDSSTQNRIFAVNGDQDNFWLYIHNKVTARRPLPYFGQPNTLGFV